MKPTPEGWKTNPTGRARWDYALYPLTRERAIESDLLQSLLAECEGVRVEQRGGRFRVLVEVEAPAHE